MIHLIGGRFGVEQVVDTLENGFLMLLALDMALFLATFARLADARTRARAIPRAVRLSK